MSTVVLLYLYNVKELNLAFGDLDPFSWVTRSLRVLVIGMYVPCILNKMMDPYQTTI